MEEYPNSEEEFELMYDDELDMLRDQEDPERNFRSRKSLNFATPKTQHQKPTKNVQHRKENRSPNPTLNASFETDFAPFGTSNQEIAIVPDIESQCSRKRTVQNLFGDIDDILEDELSQNVAKKSKNDLCEDLVMIERIVELRKAAKTKQNPMGPLDSSSVVSREDRDRNNLSYSVPRYSFIGATRSDSVRVYVRMHTAEYEKEDLGRALQTGGCVGLMGDGFKDVLLQAKEHIAKKQSQQETPETTTTISTRVVDPNNTQLWVGMYKPHRYPELLSDESTNRVLLRWLKLWDGVVFNRKPKQNVYAKAQQKAAIAKSKFLQRQEHNLKVGEDGRPEFKVALLCGPPGLGKTTLAHIVAKHAGYNIVEVNASDERSIESFKNVLETSTQMKSVLDPDNRPNCLIFDEIDGAPANSVDLLVKFVIGTSTGARKKKGAAKRKPNVLRRPIICICNDVYVPALRPLRQIAFVVNFPPTVAERLAERLVEISTRQELKADVGALLALCAKTHNDIRACLSVLQFLKVENKPVTLSQIYKTSLGQKDVQKGLFDVWQEIFQIVKIREKAARVEDATAKPDNVLKVRMEKILSTVQAFGDYERLMQGVFENYVKMKVKDSDLLGTCEALEWFCFVDVINKDIQANQHYGLFAYLPYAFVVWHFAFAGFAWPKISYPSAGYEAFTKTTRNNAIITEILRGMQPLTRAFVNHKSLKLEILPLLSQIIVPPFRPVNLHLYTDKERTILNHVISVMIDYNLNYVQERNAEGTYEFNIDPNVQDVINFSDVKTTKRLLSYSNKQLIAREIELEKMRRVEIGKRINEDSTTDAKQRSKDGATKNQKDAVVVIPNHLQRLQPRRVAPKATVSKDFFGRVINKNADDVKAGPEMSNDIWYHYKEGYNNAVRKTIKISSLK